MWRWRRQQLCRCECRAPNAGPLASTQRRRDRLLRCAAPCTAHRSRPIAPGPHAAVTLRLTQPLLLCPPPLPPSPPSDFGLTFVGIPMAWPDAQAHCATLGMSLATVRNEVERRQIASLQGSNGNFPVWIGLHDPSSTDSWAWVGGGSTVFRPWHIGEPNGDTVADQPYCVEQYDDNSNNWNDWPCSDTRRFVCAYGLSAVAACGRTFLPTPLSSLPALPCLALPCLPFLSCPACLPPAVPLHTRLPIVLVIFPCLQLGRA